MYLISRAARNGFKCYSKFADVKCMPIRTLFSREELGVTQFEGMREKIIENYSSPEEVEKFKQQFVFEFEDMPLDVKRDNLKKYIFLIDGKPYELNTMKTMLIEYYKSYNSCVHAVKEFIFGTQIMRLLYLLNLPDDAVKLFNDSDLKAVFEQMQTYKVLLDLLCDNKRYTELFDLYVKIRTQLEGLKLFPDITINCLAFAACYHLNTPTHFQYAQELWNRAQDSKQLSRSRYFLAGLAMKQNNPKYALSLINLRHNFVTVRFIQLMGFTQLGDFDKANDVLKRSIANFKLYNSKVKPYIGQLMVEDLRQAIEKSGTEEQMVEFKKIYDLLESLELLNDETLDDHLNATFPPMLPKNVYQKMKNKTLEANN